MRFIAGALTCTFGLAAFAAAGARADAAFSDQICPEATQYVVALGQLTASDPPQRVHDVAHAAANAYDNCGKRQLSDANVEPGLHYAYVREAGFALVEARALVALNRPADAKPIVQNAKRIAQDVLDWRRSYGQGGSNISSSGSDNRPSVYHDSAKDIVAAADDMLAKLAAPAPAAPAAATSSPHR